LVWLNLLFLFFITLISFATDLDFKYSHFHIVFILFESILTITGSLLVFIWLHALKCYEQISMEVDVLRTHYSTIDIFDFNRSFVYRYCGCSISLDTHIRRKNSNAKEIFKDSQFLNLSYSSALLLSYICLNKISTASLDSHVGQVVMQSQ
jgi:hypothetical protein